MKIVFTLITAIAILIAPATTAQDAEKGKRIFARCKACHTIKQGAPNRMGPNLHGVFGRPIASKEDFKYSDALSKIDGVWDNENLNQWLMSPRVFAKGTKMSFPGLRREDQRADVIAWLKENSNQTKSEPN
jgi:cytochrome c